MLNIQRYTLFDSNSTGATSPEIPIANVGDYIQIQFEGTGEMKMQGTFDGTKWNDMSVIALKGFKPKDSMSEAGFYAMAPAGTIKVRAVAVSGVGSISAECIVCE